MNPPGIPDGFLRGGLDYSLIYLGEFNRGMVVQRCQGANAVTVRVDQNMVDFLEGEAERCGITRADVVRLILDDFEDAADGGLECPNCKRPIIFNPCP